MVVCLRLAIASALSLISLALLTVLLSVGKYVNVVLALPLLTAALICSVAALALSCLDSVRPCPILVFILRQAIVRKVKR